MRYNAENNPLHIAPLTRRFYAFTDETCEYGHEIIDSIISVCPDVRCLIRWDGGEEAYVFHEDDYFGVKDFLLALDNGCKIAKTKFRDAETMRGKWKRYVIAAFSYYHVSRGAMSESIPTMVQEMLEDVPFVPAYHSDSKDNFNDRKIEDIFMDKL